MDFWRDNVSKVAFIFPGQGSQSVGMGNDIFNQYQEAQAILNDADERLGISLSNLILEGPEEELKLTENTQPAILTVSSALLSILEKEGVNPDYVAGHSLGEYSALVAAKVMSFSDAVYAVRQRGLFMEEAVPAGEGSMAAVMGLDAKALEAVCTEVTKAGDSVQLANLNSPSQIVISGTKLGVEKASVSAKEAGAKRVIPLQVSGPFHSELMKPAADKLSDVLDHIVLSDASVPVIANVTAEVELKREEIKNQLIEQLYSPVRWVETVEKLIELGVDTFVEVGPGTVLSGLVKKVNRKVNVLPVNNEETLKVALQQLKGDA